MVGDQLCVRFHDRVDDTQPVRAQRRPGFGHFHDGVREHRRLHLGGAPRKLHLDAYPQAFEIGPRDPDQLRRHGLAVEILWRPDGGVFRRGEYPSHLAEALLGVDQIRDARDYAGPAVAGFVLGNPVLSRQPRVEYAVRHVARHFLGANQHARDLRVVDGGEVGPGADVDVEAGAREQLNRRVLQGAFRYPQFQLHLTFVSFVSFVFIQRPKKASALTGVADAALAEALHFDEYRVIVAVDQDFGDRELVAGCLPLGPQPAARAAEEGGIAAAPRFCQRDVVHEAHHQDFRRIGILDDSRYQAIEL